MLAASSPLSQPERDHHDRRARAPQRVRELVAPRVGRVDQLLRGPDHERGRGGDRHRLPARQVVVAEHDRDRQRQSVADRDVGLLVDVAEIERVGAGRQGERGEHGSREDRAHGASYGLAAPARMLPATLGLVARVVALEERDVALAVRELVEREDAGHDAVEEPAIVGHDQRTPGKRDQRVLERAERDEIEVVGGLVEDEDVAAAAQQLGELDAVALAARELADLGVDHGRREPHGPEERLDVDPAVLELDVVVAIGDLLDDGVVGHQIAAALLEVRRARVLAEDDRAGIGRELAEDGADQRGLAGAVAADDPDPVALLHQQRQAREQRARVRALADLLGDALELDDRAAEARAGGQAQLELLGQQLIADGACGHRGVVAVDARLGLDAARLGAAADPVDLAVDERGAHALVLGLDGQPLGLLEEELGVVAVVAVELAAIHLADPVRDLVEERAIVGDHDQRARPLGEPVLDPLDGADVEVVGRLVEGEYVRLAEQRPRERHAAALADRQRADLRGQRRDLQRVRDGLDLVVVDVLGPRQGGVDGRGLVEPGLLRHVLEHEVAPPRDLPLVGLEQRGLALRDSRALDDHLEQRRLAGAVRADQADPVAITDGERHAREHDAIAEPLVQLLDGEDGGHAAPGGLTLFRRARAVDPPDSLLNSCDRVLG